MSLKSHNRGSWEISIKQNDNGTFVAAVSRNNENKYKDDDTGALYYVVVVILIYGCSILMMIASYIRKNKTDQRVNKYLKEMAFVRKREQQALLFNAAAKVVASAQQTQKDLPQGLSLTESVVPEEGTTVDEDSYRPPGVDDPYGGNDADTNDVFFPLRKSPVHLGSDSDESSRKQGPWKSLSPVKPRCRFTGVEADDCTIDIQVESPASDDSSGRTAPAPSMATTSTEADANLNTFNVKVVNERRPSLGGDSFLKPDYDDTRKSLTVRRCSWHDYQVVSTV